MFHREHGPLANSRHTIPSCRSILSCRISRDGKTYSLSFYLSLSLIDLSRKYESVSPGTLSDSPRYQYNPRVDSRAGRRAIQQISVEHSNEMEGASCNTHVQGERYPPTYLSASDQFASQMELAAVRSPAGLFAGRWTWLFCGPGTTAIYITSED